MTSWLTTGADTDGRVGTATDCFRKSAILPWQVDDARRFFRDQGAYDGYPTSSPLSLAVLTPGDHAVGVAAG